MTRATEISQYPSFIDVDDKGAPVEYDSLVSKFNDVTKDFVLKVNNVASGVYSDQQLLVTSGGVTLENFDYDLYDHVHDPVMMNPFETGYRLDRSAIVANVSTTSIAKDDDVYQLDNNNRVVFTARLVESNTTSLTLTNVRARGNTIAINTSPIIAGTILGRKGGTATVANLNVTYVSVINFYNAPTKYSKYLKIRRMSTSDKNPTNQRVFNSLTPFNPINIMLSE